MKRSNKYTMQRLGHAGSLALGSRTTILFSVFFFLMGISAGVFLELTMTVGEKNNLAMSLQQYLYTGGGQTEFSNIFFTSITNNLVLLLIIFLAGLSALGFPIAFAALVYKGLALGFCAGLILESMQTKGMLVILTSVIPQNLILIPVFILAATAAANYARWTLSNRRHPQKKSLKETSGSFVLLITALAVTIAVACTIEAILGPTVLSP